MPNSLEGDIEELQPSKRRKRKAVGNISSESEDSHDSEIEDTKNLHEYR